MRSSRQRAEVSPALVILAKAPEIGQVKTRLASSIGPEAALAVYRRLLARSAALTRGWDGPVLLAAAGADAAWAGTGLDHLPRRPQPAGGLGCRIHAALAWGLESGSTSGRAMVIGADCPAITPGHLRAVAGLLEVADIAFGPADDGGFWSVAVSDARPLAVLGDDTLPWSTGRILVEIQQRLATAGLTSALGPQLRDVDDAADLAAAEAAGDLPLLSALSTPGAAC